MAPGPPFVFGALLVFLALLVAAFIPETTKSNSSSSNSGRGGSGEEGGRMMTTRGSPSHYHRILQHASCSSSQADSLGGHLLSGVGAINRDSESGLVATGNDLYHFETIHKRSDGSEPLMHDTDPL